MIPAPAALQNLNVQNFLIQLCEPLGCSAVVLPDGRALHVAHENIVDIGTLPHCAQLAHQYLHLQDGDVALTNDPFAGGSFLGAISLVTAVSLLDNNKPDILLALRFSLKPRFEVGDGVTEMALHIPPTPIAHGGVVNESILSAIQSHPQCAKDFVSLFRSSFEKLVAAQALVKAAAQTIGIDFNRNQVRDYLAASHKIVQNALSELPAGEFNLQTQLETGERLKLHLEFTGHKVIFDFTGTENSKHFHLTNQATFGVCYAALMAALTAGSARSIPFAEHLVNSGSFELVEVKTPVECFLNAQPPASTFLGALVGGPTVAQILFQAIGNIVARARQGSHVAAPCLINLQFKDTHFFDFIPGGQGGTSLSRGEDAMGFWHRLRLRSSVEEIEKRHPVVMRTITTRSLSGGLGLQRGGHGMIKTYECLANAKLHWWAENMKVKPEGYNGAKDGSPCEIYITRGSSGERTDLGQYGSLDVYRGDSLTVMSAGGGGFGVTPGPNSVVVDDEEA